MASGDLLSGLVVEIPEAEQVTRPLRLQLDPQAALGVPAHVTVLFPFVPPDRIDDAVVQRIRSVCAGAEAFDYRFERTAWFSSDVLWLAPQDPEPFRALAARVATAFPEYPPYQGAFAEVVPHLTVGQGRPLPELRAAEREVRTGLPLTGRAAHLTVMVQPERYGRWRRRLRVAFDSAALTQPPDSDLQPASP